MNLCKLSFYLDNPETSTDWPNWLKDTKHQKLWKVLGMSQFPLPPPPPPRIEAAASPRRLGVVPPRDLPGGLYRYVPAEATLSWDLWQSKVTSCPHMQKQLGKALEASLLVPAQLMKLLFKYFTQTYSLHLSFKQKKWWHESLQYKNKTTVEEDHVYMLSEYSWLVID